MLSFKQFLTEGLDKQLATSRLSKFLNTKDPNLINQTIQLIANADPTPNKEFFPWLINQFTQKKIRLPEDEPIIKQDLTTYANAKKRNLINRNINKFINITKKPNDITTFDRYILQQIVDELQNTKSQRQIISNIKMKGAKQLYKDSTWTLIEITEPEAARYYAKNTRWCTSNPNTAAAYLNQAPLYTIYHNKQIYAQLYIPDGQFMNPQDQPIKIIPNELLDIFLNNIELDDDDKFVLIAKAPNSPHFQELKKHVDQLMNKEFNHVITNWNFADDSEDLFLNAWLTIPIPPNSEKYLKNHITKYEIQPFETRHSNEFYIEDDRLTISVDDYISFYNLTDQIDKFLNVCKKADQKYFQTKNEIYQILYDAEIITPHENLPTKLNNFHLNEDELDAKGFIKYETYFFKIGTTNYGQLELGTPQFTKYKNLVTYENKEAKDKYNQIVQNFFRSKLLQKTKYKKSQQQLFSPEYHHTPSRELPTPYIEIMRENFLSSTKGVFAKIVYEIDRNGTPNNVINAFLDNLKTLDRDFGQLIKLLNSK